MMYQSGQSQSVDGLQGGLPSKTPVSLLQELCMRRGISPKYDLLQIEGPVHEPTFVYRVTVGEFAANGSGQTKKKAKHAAAKAVLDIIIQGGSGSQGQSGTGSELSSQIVSPYDDGIPGNPVGALQELCMSRRWPPPTYDLTAEEGFPHERTFSICCTIGSHKEIGAGKSKKLSKRQAAHKMLQKLKDQPVEHAPMNVLADDDDEVNKESACLVSDGSRPSLNKACTKDSLSILHFKRTCPHLSAIFNTSTFQVCESCFNICENERRKSNAQPYPFSYSQDLNGVDMKDNLNYHLTSKANIISDENHNIMKVNGSLSELPKNLSEGDGSDACNYSNCEVIKLEQIFDKLFMKHAEEVSKENRDTESPFYRTVNSPEQFHNVSDLSNETQVRDAQNNIVYKEHLSNGGLLSTLQTLEEGADGANQSSPTPTLIKGLLKSMSFDKEGASMESSSPVYSTGQ